MKISYAILGFGALLLAAAAVIPNRPAVVASVDIERLFEKLEESKYNEAEVRKVAGQLEAERNTMSRELEDMKAELETYKANSPSYQTVYKKMEEKMAQMGAQGQYGKIKVEAESAQRMADMYQRIKDAAKGYAKSNNIDYVLVNDSIPPIEVAGMQGTKQQMALRRFLYATDEFDITDALVVRMNEEFTQRPKTP
jgi:Skp family chaperone for outer membrane proteins